MKIEQEKRESFADMMKHISGKMITFKGSGPEGHCQVQLFRPEGVPPVFVATEMTNNHGPSITNAAEKAFMEACVQFNVLPEQAIWIEHYPTDGSHPEDTFDLVHFTLDQDGTPQSPQWSPLGLAETIKMTGGTVQELTGCEPTEEYLMAERKKILDEAVAAALEDVDD